MATRGSRNKRRLAIIKQNRLLRRWERVLEREVVGAHRKLAQRIGADFHYGSDEVVLSYIDDFQAQVQRILFNRLRQAAHDFGKALIKNVEQAEKSVYFSLEHKGAIDIFEESVLDWIRVHAVKRATQIAETLRGRVRKVLQETFADGQGEAATAKKLREEIGGKVSLASAARIARTEAHTAASLGSDEAARSTGIEMIKEWGATEDARTRPSHAQADGQQVEMDEAFIVGDARLMYPGDPDGPAGEVINCRCVVLYRPRIGGEVL